MRFRSLSFPILSLAVLVTGTGGCRGGTLARRLQVESAPSETLAANQAPATRLETGGSGGASEATPRSGDGGPRRPAASPDGGAAGVAASSSNGAPPGAASADADLDELVSAFQNESPEVQNLVRRTAAVAHNLRRSPQTDTTTVGDEAHRGTTAEAGGPPDGEGAATRPEAETPAAQQPADGAGEKTASGGDAPEGPEETGGSEDSEGSEETGGKRDHPARAPSGEDGSSSPESPAEPATDELLHRLIAQLEKEEPPVGETAAARHVVLKRTLYALAGRVDEAAEPVEGWDASEQGFLRNQMLALATIVDPDGPPSLARRWSLAWPHARESLLQLGAATSELVVERLTFVTEILNYAEVTAVKEKRFAPGEQVLLYCEIDNFAAERLSDGYETHFQGSWEIYDAGGRRVFEQVLPPYRETCDRHRRDYYMGYELYLPRHLAEGNYRLRLTIEDLKGKKYGQSETEFAVSGVPVTAARQASAQSG